MAKKKAEEGKSPETLKHRGYEITKNEDPKKSGGEFTVAIPKGPRYSSSLVRVKEFIDVRVNNGSIPDLEEKEEQAEDSSSEQQ